MPRQRILPALVAFGVLAMLMLTPRTAAADPRDFTLVNSGTAVIAEVYVAPSDGDDWGDDILGRDVLNPGESLTIHFLRFEPGVCMYDISVVTKAGGEGRLTQVNLCATETVTFTLAN